MRFLVAICLVTACNGTSDVSDPLTKPSTSTSTTTTTTTTTTTAVTDTGTLGTVDWDRPTGIPATGPDGAVLIGFLNGADEHCVWFMDPNGPTASSAYCAPMGADGAFGEIRLTSDVEVLNGTRYVVAQVQYEADAGAWGGTAGTTTPIAETVVVNIDAGSHVVVHQGLGQLSLVATTEHWFFEGSAVLSDSSAILLLKDWDTYEYALFEAHPGVAPPNLLPAGIRQAELHGFIEDRLLLEVSDKLQLLSYDGSSEILSRSPRTIREVIVGPTGQIGFYEARDDGVGSSLGQLAVATLGPSTTVTRTVESWGNYTDINHLGFEPNGTLVASIDNDGLERWDGLNNTRPVAIDDLVIGGGDFVFHINQPQLHITTRNAWYRIEIDGSTTSLTSCDSGEPRADPATWSFQGNHLFYTTFNGTPSFTVLACDASQVLTDLTATTGVGGELVQAWP